MFVNIFDVPENGGALAVVPGSHKLPFNPWEVFGKSFKSSLTLDAELHPTEMPNYVQLAAPGELPPFCLHTYVRCFSLLRCSCLTRVWRCTKILRSWAATLTL